MAKCMICGKECGKGKTCSSTCRSRLARSVANATVEPVSVATPVAKGVTSHTEKVKELLRAKGYPRFGVTATSMANGATARLNIPNYGQSDCECMHCQSKRVNHSKNIINHGPYKTEAELGKNEINRVSLPGDADYS